ncbi:MAG: hypothetical protein SOZ59_03330 [Candidatus Limivivens sp.]|nr:hypothetical protein [Candidatus Limivivens sp.]
MNILKIKEALEGFYRRYGAAIRFFGRVILGFLVFVMIRRETGYLERLNSPVILTGLSLLCGILPANLCVLLAVGVVLLHFYSLSWCALAVGGGILMILLLLYFGIAPENGYGFLLTPVAFSLNVPLAVPMVLGLTSHSSSLFGMLFGTIWYFTMRTIGEKAAVLRTVQENIVKTSDIEKVIGEGTSLIEGILKRRELFLMLLVCLAVWIVVRTGRRMMIKYAWTVAIGLGTLVYLAIMIVGNDTLDLSWNLPAFVAGTVLALLIALIVQLFLFLPDYRRVESVQFEDDDYYYYVRAIPKKRSSEENPEPDRPETESMSREERRRMRRENREPDLPQEPNRIERT